jgi:hypothetical protein
MLQIIICSLSLRAGSTDSWPKVTAEDPVACTMIPCSQLEGSAGRARAQVHRTYRAGSYEKLARGAVSRRVQKPGRTCVEERRKQACMAPWPGSSSSPAMATRARTRTSRAGLPVAEQLARLTRPRLNGASTQTHHRRGTPN